MSNPPQSRGVPPLINTMSKAEAATIKGKPDTTMSSPTVGISSLPSPGVIAGPPSKVAAVAARAKFPKRCIAERLGVDIASAAAAAAFIAPVITMIDKGIIENASGKRALGASVKASLNQMIFRPHKFFAGKPFLMVWGLYAGTYFSSNAIDTYWALDPPTPSTDPVIPTPDHQPYATYSSGSTKMAVTTAVNMTLCLNKDRVFTRDFANALKPRPVPLPTYLLFAARDTLTIFASFIAPSMLTPHIPRQIADPSKSTLFGWKPERITQIAVPAACQIVSTPLHLLGLDLYNYTKKDAGGSKGRMGRVAGLWAKSCAARVGRVVPAFGIGGVLNREFRESWMGNVEKRWEGRV